MLERSKTKMLRCAVYTRKSSEEGLEQDFNSLQAQREACEAYIASQKHEGWKALANVYDDGGYSGGSMERPALRRLLADITSGSVDVVVVYKVDRLTRSLADFAKIVEIFDAQGVSFVSVTQQFNTTTSMGRLTLNVLLSFAQFEREVTGERIRDKVAASKKKGMWMGGWVPLGYDLKDRTLHINKAEAKTIRTIFRLYLERGNVRSVQAELGHRKLTTKCRVATAGRMMGAQAFTRGHIYHILSNPLYNGEIRHKGTRHPGQHPAIIDRETWDAVQRQLHTNGHKHKIRSDSDSSNLLTGLLLDAQGHRLTPTHSVKNGKRYRYYAVLSLSGRTSKNSAGPILRIAAHEIEQLVIAELKAYLTDHKRLVEHFSFDGMTPTQLRSMLAKAKAFAATIEKGAPAEIHAALTQIVERVVIMSEIIRIQLKRHGLLERLAIKIVANGACDARGESILLEVATSFARRGVETKLVVSNTTDASTRAPDPALLKAVARGHFWFEELVSGRVNSIAELGKHEGVTDRYVSLLIELAFLTPSMVERILEGRQPLHITRRGMVGQIPLRWMRDHAMSAEFDS